MFHVLHLTAFLSLYVFSFGAAFAQTQESEVSLSQKEPWRSLRMAVHELQVQACEGSPAALQQVRERLATGDPVIAGTLRHLRERCDVLLDLPLSEVVEYEQRAADLGYPLAIGLVGERRVRGDAGLDQDIERGLVELDRAVAGGNVDAIIALVKIWSDGKSVQPDFDRVAGLAHRLEQIATSAEDRALEREATALMAWALSELQQAAEKAIEQEQAEALEASSTRERLFESAGAIGNTNPAVELTVLQTLSNGNTPNPSRMKQRRFERSFD